MTYNLAGGGGRRPRPVGGAVASALDRLEPEVVALQEVLEPRTDSGIRRLADALGLDVVFAGNFPCPRGVLGNALLSRSRIADHENRDVSLPRREPRGILRARLDNGLDVYNVHFGLRQRERAHQWRQVMELVGDRSAPFLLCGDFNDWAGAIDRRARRAGLINTLSVLRPGRRRTYPSRFPLFGLDRIYVHGLAAGTAEVLRGEPWTRLSDHLPVVADLELPHRRPLP